MYLLFIVAAFTLGGLAAGIMRIELLSPDKVLLTAKQYNQFFTLHGAIMVFLFIIPSIPAALGNFFLPLQIGAKDVAFPKLNLASLYIYVFGALFCVYSMWHGAVDTGWTFYTPYSTTTDTSVISMTLGAFILGFSSILTGMNFIVTVHKMRAPGMTWFRMPLFVWSLYATSILQVLATPVLAITLLLLIVEKTMGIGIFDPAIGGDPVLFQHFFWFYSHPAVYIMILPAMGIMSELFTTFTKKNIFGYKAIAYSSIAIALVSFLVWGHHMFLSGQSDLASTIFSALTFIVAIPSAIKVFNWISTMYKGSIDLKTPFLYGLSFLFLFSVGGFTGIVLGTLSLDVHMHDTYYVVAHFHYVMMGGTVMGFLGGLHYWWPKMFGKMYNEFWAKIACALIFVGFNMVFFTQFILGSKGMPRRYYSYLDQFQPLHQFSTSGTWVMGLGFIIVFIYLINSLFRKEEVSNSPWGGITLEWQTTSPPPVYNFIETPIVDNDPYDFEKVKI
ncbi:cytochrome c oxidase subunit I [Candidatus Marinamargulisbacteria bacterium SCGC AG-410-N11]|nr:cytochrome c oxidase subunit I [Candidatus Marinamargulisbacteria bacterium SCGC AG-410-N11]